MCKKRGLSQQGLADLMDIKRGKVAGYFYETQAKPDFYEKLGEQFGLNVGKFLTVEMNDANYDSFFYINSDIQIHKERGAADFKKSDVIDLLLDAKYEQNEQKRDKMIDDAIRLYGKVLDENSDLKEELLKNSANKGS